MARICVRSFYTAPMHGEILMWISNRFYIRIDAACAGYCQQTDNNDCRSNTEVSFLSV